MILIISDHHDFSTSRVIDWLIHFRVEWFRLNSESIASFEMKISKEGKISFRVVSEGRSFGSEEVTYVWYRHGNLTYHIDPVHFPVSDKIRKHISYEWKTIANHINSILSDLPKIGNPSQGDDLNKIALLAKAAAVGLSVPETIITDSKADLIRFQLKQGRIITKGIQRNPAYTDDHTAYFTHTKEVDTEQVSNAPDYFFPSIFQELIIKVYEVRVFFLMDTCYAMATFPNSTASAIDIRNNQGKFPLRSTPYVLPVKIQNALIRLMANIDLNCGSIDLVVDENDNFYLLEVNAIGQYDDVSKRCNYQLDREIAKGLIG